MKSREFKDVMYNRIAKLIKAIASPYRLEIIEMLSQGEKNVEEIGRITGISFANTSQHLQVMKNNNIVKTRKEGHYVYYSIINDEFLALYQHLIRFFEDEKVGLKNTI